MFRLPTSILVVFVSIALASTSSKAQSAKDAIETMRRATKFYHGQVATHGGYVYHYSLDLSERFGEGVATKDQVWVQPPGTPTVGMAYLKAHEATRDTMFLDAAEDAATALIYGQLKSGGWQNVIDFDPKGKRVSQYRNGKGGGKNISSFDDGQSQSAMHFLIQADAAFVFKNESIHESSLLALNALLKAQFPNGGFPQVWSGPVESQPIRKASFPQYNWKTEGRIKNYWDMYTLNDNVPGYIADTLIEAHQTYHDERFLTSLKKLGDFLILAQLPEPQPGWAQQYSYAMKPIWARKFEPPAVASDETQEAIETLIKIARVTGDGKYLEPIPAAVTWLKKSLLPDGQFARYNELKTNRPLYMTRDGDKYSLTYDDSDLPSHYGWKTPSRLDELAQQFANLRSRTKRVDKVSVRELAQNAKLAIESLDREGRWVSTFDGKKLVGQYKPAEGNQYLSSQVFSDHITALSEYLIATQSK